jgi:hypothetical protein
MGRTKVTFLILPVSYKLREVFAASKLERAPQAFRKESGSCRTAKKSQPFHRASWATGETSAQAP